MTRNMSQETDQELRAEADRLLASGLPALLADYGEVHIVGSYALRLMVWRDLDIHLVQERQSGRLIVNAQRIRVEKTTVALFVNCAIFQSEVGEYRKSL